jgi:microcystin-dependent protein
MSDAFIGQIMPCPYTFAPRFWAFCNGEILAIRQHTALFAIIGDRFGGDGLLTFALPDLRSRIPIGCGYGPGLTGASLGQTSGEESVSLFTVHLPAHTHQAMGGLSANVQSPEKAIWAGDGQQLTPWYTSANPTCTLANQAIGSAGGNRAHDNMPPFLGINYIICIQGAYPLMP